MKLHQVDSVRPEPAQTALHAGQQRGAVPFGGRTRAVRMTALGEQVVVLPALGDRPANHFLALEVAFGGVNDIEAGVQGAAQELGHIFLAGLLVANLRPAEAQHTDVHISLAQVTLFHGWLPVTAFAFSRRGETTPATGPG